MKIKSILILAAMTAVILGLGRLSGAAAGDMSAAYHNLRLPPLSPPESVFPVVWSILYPLMAIGAWLVYRRCRNFVSLRSFAFQLAVNLLWSPLFFGAELYLFGALWSVLLVYAVLKMINDFADIQPLAAWLQLPYLLWSVFAVYLSFGVYWLNS